MMAHSLRKNLLKAAAREQIDRGATVGVPVAVTGAVLLTVMTTPWLAPLWLLGVGGASLALALAGARTRLQDPEQIQALARQAILSHHAPRELPPDLAPYVNQAIKSAVEIVSQVEQQRGQGLYASLRDVVDTVGELLDRIVAMSDRIVATERLFASLQQQVRQLPANRLQGEAAREFDRNLFNLQRSIDGARQQIADATSALQQMEVQTLMIRAQDASLVDDVSGDVRRIANDQAELLQAQISAMNEVASLTTAATGRLLKP